MYLSHCQNESRQKKSARQVQMMVTDAENFIFSGKTLKRLLVAEPLGWSI